MIHIFKAITLPRSPRRNRHAVATTPESIATPQTLRHDLSDAAATTRPIRYDQHDMTAPLQSPRHGSYGAIHFSSARNVSSSVWPERHASHQLAGQATRESTSLRIERHASHQHSGQVTCGSISIRVKRHASRPPFGSSDMRIKCYAGRAACRSSGTKIKGHATRTSCRSNVTRLTQHMNRTAYELARKWRNGARLQKTTTLLAENERKGPRYLRTKSNSLITTHL